MTIRLPRPVLDADASAGGLGGLPEWDLSDLYAAPDAPEVARDLAELERACTAFAADYQGRLATLDAAGMLGCIHRHERIEALANIAAVPLPATDPLDGAEGPLLGAWSGGPSPS